MGASPRAISSEMWSSMNRIQWSISVGVDGNLRNITILQFITYNSYVEKQNTEWSTFLQIKSLQKLIHLIFPSIETATKAEVANRVSMRIRIQHIRENPDPRIWWQKIVKFYCWNKNYCIFCNVKNCNILILGLHEGRPVVQATGEAQSSTIENLQHSK